MTSRPVICRYVYDPLDRIIQTSPSSERTSQRFYCSARLVTEILGPVKLSIFQHDDQLLAQLQSTETSTFLLATDQQRSVVNRVDRNDHQAITYSPYGYRSEQSAMMSLLGFNGERRDPVTGYYLLGNGYRAFNPLLMRFNCPDSLSPFKEGGLNPYAYCWGDPVNRVDPNGHIPAFRPPFPPISRRPLPNHRPDITNSLPARPPLQTSPATIAGPAGRLPYSYSQRGTVLDNRIRSRLRGSAESMISSSSSESLSSIHVGSLGSNGSINSSGSDSYSSTVSLSSRGRTVSVHSDWSGSGRRRNEGWRSTELQEADSLFAPSSSTRIQFEDTTWTFTASGDISFNRDFAPTESSRIRQ